MLIKGNDCYNLIWLYCLKAFYLRSRYSINILGKEKSFTYNGGDRLRYLQQFYR